jgi:sporulation protein YlmC with PRC-barrel domain
MNAFFTILFSIVFLVSTAIGLTNVAADAAGDWGKTYKLSTLNKAEVKNLQGEKLGEIEDFIMDARSGRIAFVVFSHAGVAGLGQQVKILPYEFLLFNEAEKIFLLNVSREDLSSAIKVKNPQGEELGKIEDLIMDAEGRIPFVILSHKEKPIIIPFSALSGDQTGKFLVLDATEEKLASAPPLVEDSVSASQAEEIYRYYGQRPYWTSDEADQPALPRTIPLPEF